ncbi:lsd1/2 complex phd finger containing protein phf2 [Gigaspora margarita]|uniref:Histone H1 n=1 Tax=Gigaspora margarita TaxID=4874 RepID=A0A8H3ZWY5_GIGMA|nr:lsd1/2 complex phd finger containing protein phf2 [Gigaspora margarita]
MMNYEDQGMVMKLPDPYSEQNNFVHRDAYNKINFTEWGEEDGDFELEEEFNQSNQMSVIQDDNTQQRELSGGGDHEEIEKTINPDQIHLTPTHDDQVDEVTIDDDTHFPPRDNEMKSILEEIEKLEQSESVQSEKGRKKVSKKSTQRKKSKADTDSLQPTVENQVYSEDGNDSGDDHLKKDDTENSASITKSGRKIHKPIFFNPSSYIEPKKKLNDTKDSSTDSNKVPSDSKKSSSKRSLEKRNQKSSKTLSKPYDILMSSDNNGESLDISQNFQDSQQILGSCDSSNSALDALDPEIDSIVCEICHEGLSKKGNWIILCDRCDTPYHQLCHIPTIDDDFADSDKEWICMGCTNSRTKKRQKMNNPEMIDTTTKILPSEQIITPNTDISTAELDIQPSNLVKEQSDLPISALLTREQKVEYLSSLPQAVLVDLILLAEHMQPGLPLYPANVLQRFFQMNEPNQDEFQPKTELATPSTEMDITELSLPSRLDDLDRPSQLKETPEIMSPVSNDGPPNSMNVDEFLIYTNMIVRAISVITQPNGNTAQTIYNWIKGNYAVPMNFQHTAKKYLSEMLSKGILIKTSKAHYKLNPTYNHSSVNCDSLFKPLNVKNLQNPNNSTQSPRKSLNNSSDPTLLLSQSLNGQVNQESFQQSIGLECQIDKGLSQQSLNFVGQTNQFSFHQKTLIEQTNQVLPQSSQTSSIQQSKSPLQHVNRTLSNLSDHASSNSPSGSQPSNLISIDNQIKDINLINNDLSNQKPARSLVSVASLMNNDQARTGLRIPQSYQMDRYLKQNNIQARNNIRPPSQIPSGLKRNSNQSRSDVSRSHSTVMNHISMENGGKSPNGIPSLSSMTSHRQLSTTTNNNDQSNVAVPSVNSFSSQQRYTAINNNNQSPIAARPLLPIPTNQSFSTGNTEIGSQSMIVPPMQPIQPNPQQSWPTSFNSFYMIPNSNESNQYGLMQTYSYSPNQNQISYDGHNAMHNSLMNENSNNNNGQPRNSPVTPHLQPMGQIGQMGQSLNQR